ncbi:MAG: hypothetical protein P4L84_19500 [Isosphaeraceae bacterium]|nr:hypothetical protein [Isosphaeraceae bacterium]
MATKKTTGEPKAKDAPAAQKAGGKATAAKETPQKTKVTKAAPQAEPAAKKPAAPVKLSSAQSELLAKISAADPAGYLSAKKAEQRSIEALAERKLIKKGAKDKASGNFRYLISNAGKKHLGAQPAATPSATPAPTPAEQPAAPTPAVP